MSVFFALYVHGDFLMYICYRGYCRNVGSEPKVSKWQQEDSNLVSLDRETNVLTATPPRPTFHLYHLKKDIIIKY